MSTEPREHRQLAISVEVPKERVDQELRKAANKVSSQYRLPGFRKGHAPYHVVVQQFGLANLYSEFVDDLGQEVFKQALEQEAIVPYGVASLEDIQFDPLVYKLVIPLDPEVTLGDYRAVRIEEEPAGSDDAKIDDQINRLLEQRASWQNVARPSKYGDTLSIDVRSIIPATDESEEIVVLSEDDWEVTPDEENPMDPPGFDAALVGLTAGETKTFELSWPEESRSVHAGKTATFTVSVKEVTAWAAPELTDELAKELYPDAEGAADLRAKLSAQLAETDAAQRANAYITKILDAVLAESTIDYPPVMVEDQIDSMMQEFDRRLRQFGIENVDAYFTQVGQDKAEYRESMREEATKTAERNLILSEIVKAEQITVDDEAIEKRIRRVIGKPTTEAEMAALQTMFDRADLRAYFTSQILYDRTLKRLTKIARGEEVPAPGETSPDEEADEGWEEAVDEEMAAIAVETIEEMEEGLAELEDELDESADPESIQAMIDTITEMQEALATSLVGIDLNALAEDDAD
ncbi:MAG: trigger factor, partial [Caldilineaceae bacterium]